LKEEDNDSDDRPTVTHRQCQTALGSHFHQPPTVHCSGLHLWFLDKQTTGNRTRQFTPL